MYQYGREKNRLLIFSLRTEHDVKKKTIKVYITEKTYLFGLNLICVVSRSTDSLSKIFLLWRFRKITVRPYTT
jgi:hypothetical protein